MTFNKWWADIGSGMTPMPEHDDEEHTRRVAESCWGAAQAARQAVLEDVAMSLKKCAWALRRGTAPALGEESLELLARHGLLGFPLRGRPGFDTLPDDYEAGHGA